MIKTIYDDRDEDCWETKFLIHSMKTHIVNSLRRTIMADYKKYGISEKNITINTNQSILHNEIIRHRIAMISVDVEEKTDDYSFTLKKTNDTNEEYLQVLSDDIVCDDAITFIKGIPIIELKRNQTIDLVGHIDYNDPKNGGCQYRATSNICFSITKQAFIKESNENVIEYLKNEYDLFTDTGLHLTEDGYTYIGLFHNLRNTVKLFKDLGEKFNITADDLLIKECEYNDCNIYSFTVESFFENPKDILQNSFKLIQRNFEQLLEMEISVDEEGKNTYLYVKDLSYTLANPLCRFLQADARIHFSQYNKAHPQDKCLTIYISRKNEEDNYIVIIREVIENIISYISNINFE